MEKANTSEVAPHTQRQGIPRKLRFASHGRPRGLIEFTLKEPPFLKLPSTQVHRFSTNCGSFVLLYRVDEVTEFRRTNNLCSRLQCDYELPESDGTESNEHRSSATELGLRIIISNGDRRITRQVCLLELIYT